MYLRTPLGRGTVDSLAHLRSGFSYANQLANGATVLCYLADDHGNLAVDSDGELAVIVPSEVDQVWFLGQTSVSLLHCVVPCQDGDPRLCDPRFTFLPVTEFGALLPDDQALIAIQAVSLARWHATDRFCARCGAAVEPVEAGWASTCMGCGHVEYPRMDPAVIVKVTDPCDRLLLAHNTAWGDRPMMSLPAGYVEAGETPMRAVVRELYEEVGLEVDSIEFLGAQPWPGPRSLMLAFAARVAGSYKAAVVPKPDGVEIDRARFFSRDEYRDVLESGRIVAPRKASIAHTVIVDWFGGPLPKNA